MKNQLEKCRISIIEEEENKKDYIKESNKLNLPTIILSIGSVLLIICNLVFVPNISISSIIGLIIKKIIQIFSSLFIATSIICLPKISQKSEYINREYNHCIERIENLIKIKEDLEQKCNELTKEKTVDIASHNLIDDSANNTTLMMPFQEDSFEKIKRYPR
jgi:hypothetical protein